jgi:hypothetical protein
MILITKMIYFISNLINVCMQREMTYLSIICHAISHSLIIDHVINISSEGKFYQR